MEADQDADLDLSYEGDLHEPETLEDEFDLDMDIDTLTETDLTDDSKDKPSSAAV